MSLDVRRQGAATWITLDRPDALNALDDPTKEALAGGPGGAAQTATVRADALNALDDPTKEALVGALGEAAEDETVRAVALTGSGRAFCVGQDVRELEQGYREGRAPHLGEIGSE